MRERKEENSDVLIGNRDINEYVRSQEADQTHAEQHDILLEKQISAVHRLLLFETTYVSSV